MKKIDELPARETLLPTDLLAVDNGVNTYQATITQLRGFPCATMVFTRQFNGGTAPVDREMFLSGFSNTKVLKAARAGYLLHLDWSVYASDGTWSDAAPPGGPEIGFEVRVGGVAIWTAPSKIQAPGSSAAIAYQIDHLTLPAVAVALGDLLEPRAILTGAAVGETVIAALAVTVGYP